MASALEVRFMAGTVDWLGSIPGLRLPPLAGAAALCSMGHLFAILQFLLNEEDFVGVEDGLFEELVPPMEEDSLSLRVPKMLCRQIAAIEGVLQAHVAQALLKMAAKPRKTGSLNKTIKVHNLLKQLNLTRLAVFNTLEDLPVLCELLLRIGTHSGGRSSDCLIAYQMSPHYDVFNGYLVSKYVPEGCLNTYGDFLLKNESLEAEYRAKAAALENDYNHKLICETNTFNMERAEMMASVDLLKAQIGEMQAKLQEALETAQPPGPSSREKALEWELRMLARALKEMAVVFGCPQSRPAVSSVQQRQQIRAAPQAES